MDTVSVVLIIFGRIDPTLCRNGMCAPWRVLITKTVNIVSQFAQCGAAEPPAKPDPTTMILYFLLLAGLTSLDEKR